MRSAQIQFTQNIRFYLIVNSKLNLNLNAWLRNKLEKKVLSPLKAKDTIINCTDYDVLVIQYDSIHERF